MFSFGKLPRRFLMVGGIAILLLLVFTFSNRMADFTRLSAQEQSESARITELVATQAYLADQIAYATSEAAVEEWAREEGRMAQPGDFLVVPLNPSGAAVQAETPPEEQSPAISNWRVWLEWLFYSGP